MIRCWIFRNEIRRHLDDGSTISAGTRQHLEGCPACAAMLQTHSALVKNLKAFRNENDEIEVPFLRARILKAIQGGAERTHSRTLRVIWTGVAASALALVIIAMLPAPENLVEPRVAAPVWELPKFAATRVEVTDSLETELESLKADTERAARALASSFLPSER
jgi:hypothetical protein